MGIFDPLLDKMRLNDEEDDEYMFDEEENEEDDGEEDEAPAREKRSALKKRKTYRDEEEEEEERPEPRPVRSSVRASRSNIVPMRSASVRGGMEVCLIKPTSFDDGREICETLLNGRSVVLNLEGIPTEVAQRIIDFTSGACYAMDGNLQKISNYIVIVTPKNVELTGDFNDIVSADGINISSLNG